MDLTSVNICAPLEPEPFGVMMQPLFEPETVFSEGFLNLKTKRSDVQQVLFKNNNKQRYLPKYKQSKWYDSVKNQMWWIVEWHLAKITFPRKRRQTTTMTSAWCHKRHIQFNASFTLGRIYMTECSISGKRNIYHSTPHISSHWYLRYILRYYFTFFTTLPEMVVISVKDERLRGL